MVPIDNEQSLQFGSTPKTLEELTRKKSVRSISIFSQLEYLKLSIQRKIRSENTNYHLMHEIVTVYFSHSSWKMCEKCQKKASADGGGKLCPIQLTSCFEMFLEFVTHCMTLWTGHPMSELRHPKILSGDSQFADECRIPGWTAAVRGLPRPAWAR